MQQDPSSGLSLSKNEYSAEAASISNHLKAQKRKHHKEKHADIMWDQASNNMKLAVDLAKEKGASSWLSVCVCVSVSRT